MSNWRQATFKHHIKSILTIGAVDVSSLAASARRAGYNVYAADYYGDKDLEVNTIAHTSIIKQKSGQISGNVFFDFTSEMLIDLMDDFQKRHSIDISLLTSGLDDSPASLKRLDNLVPILGNSPDLFHKVRDRENFFTELKRLNIPHPKTIIAQSFQEVKAISKDFGFPLLIKPIEGFGGVGIRKILDIHDLEKVLRGVHKQDKKIVIQEYLQGKHASASVISVPDNALTLMVSEQLLGMSSLGQQEPFGYCGNIFPLSETDDIVDKCRNVAERVVTHFNLLGSNGVDMVISDTGTPYVIEVNPRFQGTIECVEHISELNLVQSHISTCIEGILPKISRVTEGCCSRQILFAKKRSIMPDLGFIHECRDVPLPGSIVEEGEPICSILIEDQNTGGLLKKARQISDVIYNALVPVK